MKDQLFDRQLKEMLDRLDEPYRPETWDALSKKLDMLQDPPHVDPVDEVVYSTLQQLEPRYEASHWAAMSRRMDVIRRRTLVVRFTKALEAAAVILLLIRFAPELTSAVDGMVHQPIVKAQPKTQSGFSGEAAQSAAASVNPSIRAAAPAKSAAQTQALTNDPGTLVVAPLPHVDGYGLNFAETVVQKQPVALPDTAEWAPPATLDAAQPVAALASFEVPLPDSLADEFDYLALMPIVQKAPRYSPFYFSASIFGEFNRFRTADATLSEEGYGATTAVGRRGKRWQLEAGLGYANKQYTPTRSVEIYDGNLQTGYFGATMSKASADVLQLPIRFLRLVGQKSRLKMLAGGGITPNVILDKQYDYDAVYYDAPQGSGPNLPLNGNKPKRSVPGKGLLEGGNWKDNNWTTADFALQFVWPAGKKNSFFLQPVFHLALDKVNFGNEPVQHNSFSVQAGVQTTL
ncbi:MAG: hypothetical protein ACOYNO_01520 [Saprospiraceae bacterium]